MVYAVISSAWQKLKPQHMRFFLLVCLIVCFVVIMHTYSYCVYWLQFNRHSNMMAVVELLSICRHEKNSTKITLRNNRRACSNCWPCSLLTCVVTKRKSRKHWRVCIWYRVVGYPSVIYFEILLVNLSLIPWYSICASCYEVKSSLIIIGKPQIHAVWI